MNPEFVDDQEPIGWAGDLNPLADVEEKRVIFGTLDSFRQYRKNAHYNVTHRRRQSLYALSSKQWQMLAAPPFSLLENLNAVDDAIDTNAAIAEEILSLGLQAFSIPEFPSTDSPLQWHNTARPNDMAKAHSTIRQLYRDWSAEGVVERDLITTTVLSDLHAFLPNPTPTQGSSSSSGLNRPPILVPGAGLARLVLDLTLAGWPTTGNEISYHQLLTSNWILNHISHANQYTLFPFSTTFTNLRSRNQQLTRVSIPDIHPATAIAAKNAAGEVVGEMNMHAGDFVSTYKSPEQRGAFAAIVSVFFVDTAPNLIRYIEAVVNCLAMDGVWINIGPLLWHSDEKSVEKSKDENGRRNMDLDLDVETDKGIAEPGSFELTDEEVILLLQKMGFEVLQHEMLNTSTTSGLGYIQDPESMLQNLYRCSHWVVRKIREAE